MINKRYLTWQEVEILVGNIVNDLRDDQAAFDEMLVVARGGLVPAGLISKRLDIRNIITASVLFYSNSTDSHAFLQFPEEACISGRKLLIVDDVWNTGRTIMDVKNRVKAAGGKATTAVLHYKPMCSKFTDVFPDYVGEEVTDHWIVYPWDPVRLESGVHRFK